MTTFFKKYQSLAAIVLIVGTAALTYGIHLDKLGFYLDDWYILWAGQARGASLISDLHQFDRPLMGIIFGFNYSIFGKSALAWQIYSFILRTGSALSVYWIMRLIWPDSRVASTSVAILTLVYPGFLEQPNAMTYSNHIGSFFLAVASIALSIKGVLEKNRFLRIGYILISVILASVYLFYIEFMMGLEGLRLWLFWMVLRRKSNRTLVQKLIDVFLRYLPYLLPVAAMVIWRVFFFESGRTAMNFERISGQYLTPSFGNILRITLGTATDLLETALFAWFTYAYSFLREAGERTLIVSSILGLFLMLLFGIYQWQTKRFYKTGIDASKEILWTGIIGVLTALIPIILVGREVILDQIFNGFNRYTLPASVGAAFLIVGILNVALNEKARPYALAGLIGLSFLTHYHNSLRYEKAWEQEKNLWWQTAWRIPNLEDGALLVALMPAESRFLEGYELWAPANIIYRPGMDTPTINGQILNNETRDRFLRGKADTPTFRGVTSFDRDYDNTILLTFPNKLSCLHLLDSELLIDNNEESTALQVAPVSSNQHVIISEIEGHLPPYSIFGQEPSHSWCYYFQKLELARQMQNWELAAQLADEALANDFKPLNPAEWFPTIEAYLNTGRFEEARQLAKIIRNDRELRNFLCVQLEARQQVDAQDPDELRMLICQNP